jgi:DNA-binding response OmpR family regulator
MNSEKTTVLIIDDEEDLCYLLANLLTAQGFSVSTSFTLKSGMDTIRNQHCDWIILDNDLPDGQGWESLSVFRQLSPQSSFIMISANPDSAHSDLLRNVYYLIKPIHVNSITSLIRSL